MFKHLNRLYKLDWLLLAAVLLLTFWGIVVIYSIALGQGAADGQSIWTLAVLRRQIFSLIIGIVLFFVFSVVNYRIFYTYSGYFFGGIIILLTVVLFWGSTLRGTTGWFKIGDLGFQPVEIAKPILIIVLARYFTDHARYLKQFRHIVASGVFTLLIMGLILAQPDFGSAAILLTIWLGIMFTIGVQKKYLMLLVLLIIIAGIFSWFFVLKDYQKERIEVFLNPQSDQRAGGYNVTQSIIAIGSGRLFGKGLGFGSQSRLKFLPESHTDFIFAVIAEEMGFFSLLLFFLLFGFLYYRLIKIGRDSLDDFGFLFCIGVAVSLFSQMFINIAMNMGMMPVTGLPLPFVSFGGSSLIMSLAMIGIVENVRVQARMISH